MSENGISEKNDVRCAGCGHPIGKHHPFFVHKRGTKDAYEVYHSECLNLVKGKRKKTDKKAGKNA